MLVVIVKMKAIIKMMVINEQEHVARGYLPGPMAAFLNRVVFFLQQNFKQFLRYFGGR